MIAITVSTNYSDILPFVISANAHYFTKWLIVTDVNDAPTISLLKTVPNIVILYWDFKNNGSKFDKGGAIRHAQLFAYHNFPTDWYLLLDSDICLTTQFAAVFNQVNQLNINNIYGVQRRDFYKMSDYKNGINFSVYKYEFAGQVHGYFQLYKQKLLYKPFKDASSSDVWFCNQFPITSMFNINCDHLGKSGHNWNGRELGSDFIID